MDRKYEFTGETKSRYQNSEKITLHRIKALRDFSSVKAGDLGGWIEKEKNLSHEGDAWVADEAMVYGDAVIYENGWVGDNAKVISSDVHNNALVCDNAIIHNVSVFGDAHIYGDAGCEWANVFGNAQVYGNAKLGFATNVSDNAQVYGNAKIYCADIYENAEIYGDVDVGEKDSLVEHDTFVKVFGNVKIFDGDSLQAYFEHRNINQQVETYMDNVATMEPVDEMVMGD